MVRKSQIDFLITIYFIKKMPYIRYFLFLINIYFCFMKSLLFTDLHLSDINISICNDFIDTIINYFRENKDIHNLFFLGDFFDNRKGLSQDVLLTSKKIINRLKEIPKLNIIFIPGNHDKYNPLLKDSYLEIFKDDIFVCNEVGHFKDGNVTYWFFPYFEKEKLQESLDILKDSLNKNKNEINILLNHLEYTQIPAEITKEFDLILNGHIHDKEKTPKGEYIGSCFQQNFSEDKYKGFSILDDNLKLKQIIFNPKEYVNQIVDLNIFTEEKAKEFILNFKEKNPDKYLRIELRGFNKNISQLKDFCKENGVDCISKVEILLNNGEEKENQISISLFSKEQINKYYEDFKNTQTYSVEVDKILKNLIFNTL